MPKSKWSSKAKNLGAFAVKSSEDNDTSHISKAIGADVGSDPHDSESEDDNEIEIQEENDIPHPRDHADLLSWLQISDTHLSSLHTMQRAQELRKFEKERNEREKKEDAQHKLKNSQISDFFTCPQTIPVSRPLSPETDPETEYSSDSDLPPVEDMDPDPSYNFLDEDVGLQINRPSLATPLQGATPQPESTIPPTSRVTIEDLEDDEDNYLAIQPSQLSPEVRVEEGLDDLPWDPAEETLPRSPAPPPSLGCSLPPRTVSYFHH
ncbi:hypothetical protein DFH08DRAFT_825450 [Mycena albidolilacea]|uniref:Uncharacterized protein n=1 Tax=Mycena albidolilacea TaxID=1033008 RepID=A0AAD6Z2F0_9AGAR|nr:hypothetical protein DFH08DRAFT_825450 [Mycena albidolilacea]